MRAISRSRWDRMVAAAEKLDPADPDFFKELAAAGKVKIGTAKHAWSKGWPNRNEDGSGGVPPILDVIKGRIAGLNLPARAIRGVSEPTDDARREMNVRAVLDATRARAQEAEIVGLVRNAVLEMIRAVNAAMEPAHEQLLTMVQRLDEMVKAEGLTVKDMSSLSLFWWRIASTLRVIATTGGEVMRMERLLLGAPEQVIGVDVNVITEHVENVDPSRIDSILDQLEASMGAVARLRASSDGVTDADLVDDED